MFNFDVGATRRAGGVRTFSTLNSGGPIGAKQYNEDEDYGKTTWVAKDLDWKPPKRSLSDCPEPINANLCVTCRRIFHASGDQAAGLFAQGGLGPFFNHLDANFLQKSARKGCRLCNLIWHSHRLRKSAPAKGEQIPLLYDFGNIVGGANDYFNFPVSPWNMFALRFFPFTVDLERINPMIATLDPVITLTLAPDTPDLKFQEPMPTGERRMDLRDDNTGSHISMHQLKQWLDQCGCSTTSVEFLPERLIDVYGGQPDMVRVVERKSILSNSQYVALSHCWGKKPSTCKLLESNLGDFMRGVSLGTLPKTFEQSCLVTRALGVRYLWIDSLCIIQDSRKDWELNAAVMWQVYSEAFCTLAATASKDSSQGLFRDRWPHAVEDLVVQVPDGHGQLSVGQYCCFDHEEWHLSVDRAPLNQRAWVFQERLLSPRIVHFSRFSIFFECLELKASERFHAGIPSRYTTSTLRDLVPRKPDSDIKKLLPLWEQFVSTYTSLGLTYESDKLVAISALSRHIGESFPQSGRYLAGLWEHNLSGQLCWRASADSSRSLCYRAPSWSWASINGQVTPYFVNLISTEGHKSAGELMKIMEIAVEDNGNPWLSTTGGHIQVRAPLLRPKMMKCHPKERPGSRKPQYNFRMQLKDIGTDEYRKKAEHSRKRLTEKGLLTKGVNHLTTLASWTAKETKDLRTFGYSDDGLPTGKSGRQKMGFADDGLVVLAQENGSSWSEKVTSMEEVPEYLAMDFGVEDETLHLGKGFQIHAGNHLGRVDLDERLTLHELENLEPLFMPVLCMFETDLSPEEGEVTIIRGLVIVPTPEAGIYRRIGSATVGNWAIGPFLCNLGNQEISNSNGKLPDSQRNPMLPEPMDIRPLESIRIALNEFVPEKWPLKELDFIPKDYALYQISIV